MLSSKLPSKKKMSASHEKSPTESKQHPNPAAAVILFTVCVWVASLCNSGLLVSLLRGPLGPASNQGKSTGPCQVDKIPANPEGAI